MSRFTLWWSARARSTKIIVTIGGLVTVLAALAILAGSDKSATTTTTTPAVAQSPAVTPETTQTVAITVTTQPRWKQQRAPTTKPLPTTQRPTTTARATTTQPPTTLLSTTTAPAAPQWVTVASLSGSAQKTGGSFRLTGAPARLSYKVDGEIVDFTIYVMAEGKNLTSDGGVPEVTVTQAAHDSTRLMRDPGWYYLVAESNNPYSVTVEELR